MHGTTSKDVITHLIHSDRGKLHFKKWTAKEKNAAISKCGLASSKYKNNHARDEILQVLHETALPVHPTEVQQLIKGLGLPPSGSSSLQQFSFFLLSYMSEKLPFPPWKPQPFISITPPTCIALSESIMTLCKARVNGIDQRPYIYSLTTGGVGHLWETRRKVCVLICIFVYSPLFIHSLQAWDVIMPTLGSTESSFSKFSNALCAAHVHVMNMVLAYHPKSAANELRSELDSAQWQIERREAPKLFVQAWNESVRLIPGACIAKFKWDEWRWLLNHIMMACRRALCASMRTQFDGDDVASVPYVGDQVPPHKHPNPPTPMYTYITSRCMQEDGRHSYYCVGAVYRSLRNKFANATRIVCVLDRMFVDKTTALAQGLPTHEVDNR